MSCLGPSYNPNLPRTWSRFSNTCLPSSYAIDMQYKGNILQYKKNSSGINQTQRYAKIARGTWTNRGTTWASQTETATNPNIKSLARVNYSGAPDCPQSPVRVFTYLPRNPGEEGIPAIPTIPPPPPPPSTTTPGNYIPSGPGPIPIPPFIPLPDGGTLVCNTVEDICTGEIIKMTSSVRCYPTTDSDVPGPIIELCFDDTQPTYYPRLKREYND